MKRIWILVAVAVLLAGCTSGAGGTLPTTSSFPVHQTPAQMLSAAMERTANASSFVLQYELADGDATKLTVRMEKDGKGGYRALVEQSCGCGVYVDGKTAISRNCENGAVHRTNAENPYPLSYILQALPKVAQGLPDRFAEFALTASPSNKGTTRFAVSGLSCCEQNWLVTGLYPPGCNGEEDDFDGFFAMTLDAVGALVEVEYTDPDLGVIHRIILSQLNQKLQITPPQWAK